MDNRPSADGSASRSVLLVGPGELPDATQRALQAAAARVTRLAYPSDADIRKALTEQCRGEPSARHTPCRHRG